MIENVVDVFQKFFDSRMEDVHTSIPGVIEKYDGHGKRTATVRPTVKLKALNGENVELPLISNVPVMFPSSRAFNLLFPLAKGDGVMILFSEAGIGNYLAGTGQVVNADDRTRFSLTDAVAIPGLWTTKNAPTVKTIELTEAGVLSLMDGTESFVLGDTLELMLNNFLTPISAITPGAVAENAAALTAIKTAATTMLGVLATMKSLKIKGS